MKSGLLNAKNRIHDKIQMDWKMKKSEGIKVLDWSHIGNVRGGTTSLFTLGLPQCPSPVHLYLQKE